MYFTRIYAIMHVGFISFSAQCGLLQEQTLAVGQSIMIGVNPYTEADLVCVWKITVSLQTCCFYTNYISLIKKTVQAYT